MRIYNWSPKSGPKADRYPPHLDLIPSTDEVPIYKIFDTMRLLVSFFSKINFFELAVTQTWIGWSSAEQPTSENCFYLVGSGGSNQDSRRSGFKRANLRQRQPLN